MIVKYILIVILTGSHEIKMQEFNGLQSCDAAREFVLKNGARAATCQLK